jgi:nucleoside-diphosphate-sugar epimerase
MLVDTGHAVRALARSSSNDARLREIGAEPVRSDLFDPRSLRDVLGDSDAILHLATHIPPASKARNRRAWQENDRIRIEGTRNLVNLALDSGISTFIYPGIVFVYPDAGDRWLDSTTPPDRSPRLESSLVAESEVQRFSDTGRRGIVLRMGAFYGPTASSTRDLLRSARRGFAMVFGPSKAYQSLIWIDDAAVAVIDALSNAPAGIYDVVDDEPLRRGELASALAHAVGSRWLLRPPTFLLRLLAGRDAMFLTRSQRVSNRKFKDAAGWSPTVPSARLGLKLLAIEP